MHFLSSFVALAALTYALWSIAGAFFSVYRRQQKIRRAGLGAIVFIVVGILVTNVAEKAARDEGFDDLRDKTAAQATGVDDANTWKASKAEQLRLAEMQAERERAAEKERQQIESARLTEEERQEAARLAEEVVRQAEEDRKEAARRVEEEHQKEADAAACLTKLDCIWNDQEIDITVACRIAVQALAKWDYEWIDGMFEPAFQPAGWAKREAGTIMVMGNKLKLQNGFGAWKRVNYLCAFDPKTKTAIEARVLTD